MHERSLVRALLQQVERVVQSNSGDRVLEIRVSIGEFSGVEAELLRAAFDELATSPTTRGAALSIERVKLECRCRDCGAETAVEGFRFECRACGGRALEIIRGEELMLESVTLAGAPS